MKEEGRGDSQNGQYALPRRAAQRIVKLKVPGLIEPSNTAAESVMSETRASLRKRQNASHSLPTTSFSEASPSLPSHSRPTEVLRSSFVAESHHSNHPTPSREHHTSTESSSTAGATHHAH